MNSTESQLQLALVKELPELIAYWQKKFWWRDTEYTQEITPREWDWIMREVEKNLTEEQIQDYFYNLNDELGLVPSTSPAWIKEWSVFAHTTAPWPMRAIAYFKTIGKEIE